MKVHIETITPERATELLGHNTSNRAANPRHIEALAKEMREGRFVTTGQTVQIADTGRLLDGQHRLMALVKAGFTCPFVIVSDLPEGIFSAIDRGRRRTSGDVLGIAGYANANHRAALIVCLLTYEANLFGSIASRGGSTSWPPELVMEYAATHDLDRAMSDGGRYYHAAPFITRTLWGFLSEVFHRIDADAAPDFLQQLANGTGLDKGDVLLFVRNRIINASLHASNSMTNAVRLEYVYMAWNRVRDGRPKGMVKIVNGELEMPR